MKMNNEQIDAKKQLDLIASLAEDARGSLNNMAFPLLLFGSSTVIGTILSYLLGAVGYGKFIFIVWIVLMGGSAIIMAVSKTKSRKTSGTDKLFSILWGSIGFSTFVMMIAGSTVLNFQTSFNSMFLMLGLLLFIGYEVSGTVIRSKLMMILGLFWIAAGIACVFVTPLMAPAIIGSATFLLEVIPAIGILLKKKKA